MPPQRPAIVTLHLLGGLVLLALLTVQAAAYARGLSREQVLAQHTEIDALNDTVTTNPTGVDDNLRYLRLNGTQVTNAGLKELAPLKNLTRLYLGFTLVSDTGLKELAPLTKLTYLDISLTQVTDAGMKELAPLKNLTNLALGSTQVTDIGVKEILGSRKLHTLSLAEARAFPLSLASESGVIP